MWDSVKSFIRREMVLCIAAAAAAASMLLAPLNLSALCASIDWRVLGLLWCLMTVVAGFRNSGVFDAMTELLLRRNCGGSRTLSVLLVLLPFFVSMAVTNDVALLAFVPFTMQLLSYAHCEEALIPILVLQTLAANLGSMATPVGNPQNLFLYGYFSISAPQFFFLLLPLTVLSLVCLAAAALTVLPAKMSVPYFKRPPLQKKPLRLYLALFALCLLTVGRLLPWYGVLPAVALSTAYEDKTLLKKADYALLATFVCFFIFSGNLARMPAASAALRALLGKDTLLTALAASQVISNVPAAVLLAPFTQDWRGLLLGTDIGGLGTPVASLASLITLKLYLAAPGAKPLRYLAVFSLYNLLGLVILLAAAALFY